jgi:hypothetical protein
MTAWERLEEAFAGREADRTPILGGWIACADHVAAVAGVPLAEYWADPVAVSVRAYRELGSDGLIDIVVPKRRDDYRIVDEESYLKSEGVPIEEAVRRVEAMPSGREIEAAYDPDAEFGKFREALGARQALCGPDLVWMPAMWNLAAKVTWYSEFGYETYFTLVGAYPHLAAKLLEIGGARGHCIARTVARAVRGGIYPHAALVGEDICSQQGPMISPAFLQEHWALPLRHSLEPILDVGCRPVWHSDGNVMPLVDMLLECGIQGFQGFQPECGVSLDQFVDCRAGNGDPLLIFGPLPVTTGLPVWSAEETVRQVRLAIDQCRGRARLVIFTANTVNPDVPLANIVAMHEAVRGGGPR